MFFTSCIIIAFFCFAFYLIWNQFLKKDTRLSTGLKILQKKTNDLQNLSSTVETQVDRHSSLMDEQIKRMEFILKKSKEVCQQLEKNIEIALSLKNKEEVSPAHPLKEKADLKNLHNQKIPPLPSPFKTKPATSAPIQALHLKMIKTQPNKTKETYFGESPFVKLGFVESEEKDNKSSALETPFQPTP